MSSEWITAAQAATIVGCHRHTIDRHVADGRIARRYPRGRKTPSLSRESGEEFAVWWREKLADEEVRRLERRQRTGPPDDGDDWLTCPAAASVIDVSPQYLGRIAAQAHIPAVRRGGRWFFRRSDVEQVAARRVGPSTPRRNCRGVLEALAT